MVSNGVIEVIWDKRDIVYFLILRFVGYKIINYYI